MSISSMLKRVAALKRTAFIEPAGSYTRGEEWIEMKAFVLKFLEPRFPDAYLAMIAGFDQIEAWDRERSVPTGLKLKRAKGKLAYEDTEHGRMHTITCRIGKILEPWPESKWALADALEELEK